MDPAALTCFLLLRSFKVVGKNQNIPQKVVYIIEMYDESKTSPSTNKVKSNNLMTQQITEQGTVSVRKARGNCISLKPSD